MKTIEELLKCLKSDCRGCERENYASCNIQDYSRELLEALLEKQKQGLLIKLPCKVGDLVHVIPTCDNSLNEIVTGDITGFAIGDNPVNNININLNIGKRGKLYQPSFDDFGKTVFTTREQAEKALEVQNDQR